MQVNLFNGKALAITMIAVVMSIISAEAQLQADTVLSCDCSVGPPLFDDPPLFPGGMNGLKKYLDEHVRCPPKVCVEGTVFVKFTIETDGCIAKASVQAVKLVDPSVDTQAVRVVQAMPCWTPARTNGRSVATLLVVPVKYACSVGSQKH